LSVVLGGEPHREFFGIVRVGVHRRVCELRLGISERCRRVGNATQHRHGIVHTRRRPNNQIVATHGVGQ